MPDILSVGARSLLSLQQALTTTGHNITNANTQGYSRQNINFAAAEAQRFGFGYLGQGAGIDSIERSYNGFLNNQVRSFTASQSQSEIMAAMSSRVDQIFSTSGNSLNTSLQQFFNSLQDVANNPASLPERQVLLSQAKGLVDRQSGLNDLLQGLNQEINNTLRTSVAEINHISSRLATLNKDILSASLSANGSSPNDLLDVRDRLLQQLSEKVSVNTIENGEGVVSVFVGNGQALVVGSEYTELQTQTDHYDSSKLEIGLVNQSGTVSITRFLNGGELQGLLDFRKRVLDPAQAQIGLMMLGISESVNQQHRVGMDLNNNSGNDLFSSGNIQTRAHTFNGGNAIPAITLNDIGQLQASDYQLNFNGVQWQLMRLSDNTTVTGPGPLVLDGLSVDVSVGTATSGDSFRFNPARDASDSISLALTDPRSIATASPIAVNAIPANTGNASISEIKVMEPNTLPLASAISLVFNPDALGAGVPGFDVTGGPGGSIAYDPASESAGKTVSFPSPGITFSVSGNPQAGDTFDFINNAGAAGDSSNMLEIAKLQHEQLLRNGQDTFQNLYGSIVADVGVITQQELANQEVEAVLLEQAARYRDNATGVNLDEEATNMIRYQQQYQASAQLIKVADQMFQSLLMSIGR